MLIVFRLYKATNITETCMPFLHSRIAISLDILPTMTLRKVAHIKVIQSLKSPVSSDEILI